jgi:biopolymer transport protein ExbD
MNIRFIVDEERTISGVNIVPVIDLCLVLLIILMVTSPMLETPDLNITLPKARTIESKERNISVTYSTDGQIAVNTEIVPEDKFIPVLQYHLAKDPDILVIVRVDKESPYVNLTEIIARCKSAGAKRVAIGTEQIKVER